MSIAAALESSPISDFGCAGVRSALIEGHRIGLRQGVGVSTATCDIRFSLQDEYADLSLVGQLADRGISDQAVTISGYATVSEKDITSGEFIDASVDEIRTRLKKYLEKHAPRANDLVILDMEPDGIAPRQLGQFVKDTKLPQPLIEAYRRRIRIARQELRRTRTPGLKLGLYQVIVPDGKGHNSDGFEKRMRGYVAASEQGMFDQLDFICPVLYQRWDSDDATPAKLRTWLADSTRQALQKSHDLTRRNGSRIPLVPILSFWVFKKRSPDDVRPAVTPESLALQLEIVQDAVGIEAILFWSGWQTTQDMVSAKVQVIDIHDLLKSTGSLPWPGCT